MIDIKMAPMLAIHNKSSLDMVRYCACYYCIKVYPTSDIVEFVDVKSDTAVCPHCGIDAVLPVHSEEDKDLMNLNKIHNYWF